MAEPGEDSLPVDGSAGSNEQPEIDAEQQVAVDESGPAESAPNSGGDGLAEPSEPADAPADQHAKAGSGEEAATAVETGSKAPAAAAEAVATVTLPEEQPAEEQEQEPPMDAPAYDAEATDAPEEQPQEASATEAAPGAEAVEDVGAAAEATPSNQDGKCTPEGPGSAVPDGEPRQANAEAPVPTPAAAAAAADQQLAGKPTTDAADGLTAGPTDRVPVPDPEAVGAQDGPAGQQADAEGAASGEPLAASVEEVANAGRAAGPEDRAALEAAAAAELDAASAGAGDAAAADGAACAPATPDSQAEDQPQPHAVAEAVTAPAAAPPAAPGSRTSSARSAAVAAPVAAAEPAPRPPSATPPAEPRPQSGSSRTLPPPAPPPSLPPASAASSGVAQLQSVHGLDTHRRNNLVLLDEDTAASCIAGQLVLLSLSTGARRYLPGRDGGGVGAVAVHPSRTLLAVGEKARPGPASAGPAVYIYSYPGLEVVKVLRGGTERAYSALAFDGERGDTLASVGHFPDFLLTLWDWRQEAIVLRAKAFSQDVYGVAFSPYFEGQLTTSGQGHIRFWRMASTFTGLKLQGAIGKFGNVELSDVAAFVELPDGKVLSSTETGELLLWDGGLIKVVLTRPGGRPCHDGPIEALLLDRPAGRVLSAGADGRVRLWDFGAVNDAEPREDSHSLELSPLDEVVVAEGAALSALLADSGGRRWVVADKAGNVYTVALPPAGPAGKGAVVTRVASHPAGAVAGLQLSARTHTALAASADGCLRALDYVSGAVLAETATPQRITAFTPLPAASPACPGGAMTAATGYRDGVVRLHARCAEGLALVGVAKAHKGAVAALAVSADGGRLVSAGEDGSVFFFDLTAQPQPGTGVPGMPACGLLAPRAFIKLPSGSGTVTCGVWEAAEGGGVLLGTNRGTILSVPLPPSDLNTHHSYEWAAGTSAVSSYQLVVPKPKRPKKKKGKNGGEEGDKEGGEQDEGQGGEDKGGEQADGEGGSKEGGEEGGAGEEEEEEEADDEADGGAGGPSSTTGELISLTLAPNEPGALLVTAGGVGHAARKAWRVRMGEPLAAPLLEGFASAPVTCLAHAGPEGRLALLGSGDGLVRLQALEEPFGSAAPGALPLWEAPLHDMQSGRVSGLGLSHDGAYLVTAAADGALHLLALALPPELAPSPTTQPGDEPLPGPAALPPRPPDVLAAAAYTLEEEKQQAERDQQVREAEEKKLSVRQRLGLIRAEFEALLAENEAAPEALRLPRADLEVDPGLRALMEAEALRREEVARLELAWESERQRLGLAKLRRYFLDGLESERVVLHSLRGGSTVTTFRVAKLSNETRAELAAMRQAAAAAAATSAAAGGAGGAGGRDTDARGKGSDTGGGPGGDAAARARLAEATAALEEGTASGKLNKADLRRLARKRREAEWAAFNGTRPDDTYDSPADLAAIEEARRTIGDFKLKSDPNYVVPEEERLTPQRKRLAMLELEEALHDIAAAFNAKFFALRDVKRKVLADVRVKLAALAELAAAAGAATGGADPDATAAAYLAPFSGLPSGLLPEEEPAEAREAVTDADLAAFAARKAEDERKAAAAAAGGLGGFAGAAAGPKKPAAGGAAPAGGALAGGAAGSGSAAHGAGGPSAGGQQGLTAAEEALAKMMAAVPQSELEKGLAAYNRRRVEHMRSKLSEEITAMLDAFDDAHSALKAEKLGLEADVKAGQMRLLVGLQELQLLREFDKRESVLLAKRQAKLDDKQEIVDKIAECTDKLETKRLELEGLVARRAAVVAELDAVVPESDPFREALVRVFHRRIKRSKKKAGGGGEDDYDSEEDEEDEDMGDDEVDDDDDGGEEVCPPGCDQSVYERVCDLREKRLDEEDMIAEFTKTIEVLRKEKEALAKKQRLVEQGLAAVNADMAEFQKEKQGRLNQVEVIVALRMHQIEYLLDGCLPDDLSACLVFSASQLRRLQARVDELEEEKAGLRAAHKELRRQHAALLRDKADKEARVAELEARAHDVQMLKFGQVIDLELLDRVSSSRGTEDLREDLKKQELAYARELAEWDAKINARMDELVVLTRENTACLNAVSELTAAQRRLESGLTATRKGLFADPVQQRRAEVEERDALVALVNAQAAELDRLKGQLLALRRKDTSMYA